MTEKKEKGSREVSTWHPFLELERLERGLPFREFGLPSRFGRFMDEFFRSEWPTAPRALVPAVDIHEDDRQYTISVELAGAKKEDVTLEVVEGALVIRGEKKSEREERKEHSRYVERSFGSFSRSFTLPADAAADRIDAAFKDGVLTISIPKLEQAKPKTIAIKAS